MAEIVMHVDKDVGSPMWNRFCRSCVHASKLGHERPCRSCWNPPGDMYTYSAATAEYESWQVNPGECACRPALTAQELRAAMQAAWDCGNEYGFYGLGDKGAQSTVDRFAALIERAVAKMRGTT